MLPRRRFFATIIGVGVFTWVAVGFIAGLIARVVVRPGQRLGCLGTIAVGLVGSVVGGTLGSLIGGDGLDVGAAGVVGSTLGAVLVLALVRIRNPPSR